MDSRKAIFEEIAQLIDAYLEFSHCLPADILARVNVLLPQLDQLLENTSLQAEQKARGFYLKAGLQLLKQNKSSTTEGLLLKSVV